MVRSDICRPGMFLVLDGRLAIMGQGVNHDGHVVRPLGGTWRIAIPLWGNLSATYCTNRISLMR